MRKLQSSSLRLFLCAVLGALLTLPTSASALTLEEVIARHIEARGGTEAWGKIQNMSLEGTFGAFSKVGPFHLVKTRDQRYFLDHVMNDLRVVIGHDGEKAWWIHPMRGGDWPQPITGIDLAVLRQKLDFVSPFFDYEAKGYTVELLGEGELEGQPSIRLKLVRPDGSEETWHLDPDTFLELGFESTGSDFGFSVPQRIFFDDFREVQGVKIPFYWEGQWYTRLRTMEAESVTLNAEVDNDLFEMPIPEEMERLADLAGDWTVKIERKLSPRSPWTESERQSTIESHLRGNLLEERYADERGVDFLLNLSWDRFRQIYRLTRIDDSVALLDIHQGVFDGEGKLVFTDLETGTPYEFDGNTVNVRITLSEITPEGFRMEIDRTRDGGENWIAFERLTYSRTVP
jgi:hypothetical protein